DGQFRLLMPALDIAGLPINDLALAAIAMAGFAALLLVWIATGSTESASRRLRELATQRDALRSGVSSPGRGVGHQKTDNLMRRVVTALNLLRTDRAHQMSLRLASAGWRRSDAVVKYMFAKLVLPALLGLGSLFYMHLLNVLNGGGG